MTWRCSSLSCWRGVRNGRRVQCRTDPIQAEGHHHCGCALDRCSAHAAIRSVVPQQHVCAQSALRCGCVAAVQVRPHSSAPHPPTPLPIPPHCSPPSFRSSMCVLRRLCAAVVWQQCKFARTPPPTTHPLLRRPPPHCSPPSLINNDTHRRQLCSCQTQQNYCYSY